MAQEENSLHTPYRPPDPVIKIMKRPSSTPSDLNEMQNGGGGGKPAAAVKTLKQREEEYAQARLRILGSAGTPEPPAEEDGAAAEEASVATAKTKGAVAQAPPVQNCAVRAPRGPEPGSKGFRK